MDEYDIRFEAGELAFSWLNGNLSHVYEAIGTMAGRKAAVVAALVTAALKGEDRDRFIGGLTARWFLNQGE